MHRHTHHIHRLQVYIDVSGACVEWIIDTQSILSMNGFMLLEQPAWSEARQVIQKLLSKDVVSVKGTELRHRY